MRRRLWIMLALPMAAAGPTMAAETADFITGTYSSKEGCDALAKHQEGQGDFLFLTSKGVSGGQLNCEFVNVMARAKEPGAVAISFCEEPGYSHPELISLKPSGQDSVEVGVPGSPYADEGYDAGGDQQGAAGANGGAGAGAAGQSANDQPGADQAGANQGGSDQAAPDQGGADQNSADQNGPDQSSSDQAGSTPEGMGNGGDASGQDTAGYVGLAGKYLRCQTPPG